MNEMTIIKALSLVLFSCCLFCHVAVHGKVERKDREQGLQQDSVEVFWYNTRDSLFELRTLAQLRGFAELVNSGIDFHGQEVRLVNDIFLNDTTGWRQWMQHEGVACEQWQPIGQEEKPFCGTFDGQGHALYGLYIYKGMDSYYQGLFGLVLDGRIRNVHLKASYIRGHDHIGGIAGMMGYTSEIRGCTMEGYIVGAGHMVGGLVGKAEEYNRIIDCGNTATVQGQRRVGGLVGSFEYGELYNCFNRGNVKGRHEEVGGLVGTLIGGQLDGQRNFEFAKGVVREVEKRRQVKAKELEYVFANNYNTGSVTGEDKVGGLLGAFMGFADLDSTNRPLDVLEAIGWRQFVANFVKSSSKRGRYFANCYNTGQISARFPVYTDGLVGHYGWNWQAAVYLLDERGERCYWSDASVLIAKVETWRLPRDMRGFDKLQEIYSIRSPRVFAEVAEGDLQTETFLHQLNEWVEKEDASFRRWRMDHKQDNKGFPVFEQEGARP